ncbi:MAG: PTS sugar transporter subunit IIC [Trichococcus sp.]|jgi:PTS system cellobiose-specific IIC component|uniref:Permease IIC component n=1 Tax=Trichococcus shcherbakoviae TaxID=2094020 RepID=A0A383TCK8_9LACT|nr:PTS sugar transporter subunit IIC [Trichococcus shcherbakoviae]MBP8683493.1 PTS sugar transporter subunit IIC [Trichococcus sp.]MBP9594803.1 PTS sugar transporter subunit IIC [Trichococcus sp.]MBP9977342.1 PTS sugar transporter subunit IIC [Trichococcus sp.]SYZ78023.1 phosphotransferase system eiic [Trichococcus shcherbakoviae]
MDKFLEFLEGKLGPIAYKLNANRYLSAIKEGFFGAMSLLIIGSMFLLVANLPIPGYADFMAGVFGADWTQFFMVPFDMTMNIMTIFVMIGMAKDLCKTYGIDDVAGIIYALVGFLILTPSILSTDNAAGIPMGNLSASGLFLGMMSTVLAVEIVRFVLGRGWTIKMPDSVPANVARSFDALIPGLFVILVFDILKLIFAMTSFETAQAFIFEIIQAPLTSIGATLPATILVVILETLLFSFGLHGPNILGAVMNPIWLTLTAENASAYAAGEVLPNIVNAQFYANFIKIGGAGATFGLALLCLFVAKSSQFKTLGKLAIGPAIFNINEPLIFGMPIVLNPILMIPFIVSPVVMTTLTYILMNIGLIPLTNGVNIPWTTPPIISGFLISGWQGAVWQVIEMGLSALIFYPFFKLEDNKAYQIEMGQIEADESGNVVA